MQIASEIPFPTTLGKAQVMINDVAAPIYYVTPTQLSVIVPYGVTGGIASVQVFNDNLDSNAVSDFVGKTSPGVLTHRRTALATVIGPPGRLPGQCEEPRKCGETFSSSLPGWVQ